jgi:ATP-dependent Clp protease protease subunit
MQALLAAAVLMSLSMPALAGEPMGPAAPSTIAKPIPGVQAPTDAKALVEYGEQQDLKRRIIRLYGEVNETSAHTLIAQMRALDEADPGAPITMVIDSPGGGVIDGLAIFDTMKSLKSPVYTTCLGQCASMGAVLLIGGESGHRSSMPNAEIMLHQVSAGTRGKVSDMQINVQSAAAAEDRLVRIIAAYSGQNEQALKSFIQQDKYLTADQARKLGFIDSIEQPIRTPTPPVPAEKLKVPVFQP